MMPSSACGKLVSAVQAFSGSFDAVTLDAFVHLAAPPPKPEAQPETKAEKRDIQLAQADMLGSEELSGANPWRHLSRSHTWWKKPCVANPGVRLKGLQPVMGISFEIGGIQFIRSQLVNSSWVARMITRWPSIRERPQNTIRTPRVLDGEIPVDE